MAANYSVNGGSLVAEKPRVWLEKPGGIDYDVSPDDKRIAVLPPLAKPGLSKHDVGFVL